MSPAEVRKVRDLLWPEPGAARAPSVFAILDAARRRSIYAALQEFEGEYRCLYRGRLDPRVLAAAPYLVQLAEMAPFTEWLIERAWGDSWGIFLQAHADIEALRQHFRRFLIVQDERGRRLYFRYYDPRVMRVYLPTCVGLELTTVFGPVLRFVVEDGDATRALDFAVERGRLVTVAHLLGETVGDGLHPG